MKKRGDTQMGILEWAQQHAYLLLYAGGALLIVLGVVAGKHFSAKNRTGKRTRQPQDNTISQFPSASENDRHLLNLISDLANIIRSTDR